MSNWYALLTLVSLFAVYALTWRFLVKARIARGCNRVFAHALGILIGGWASILWLLVLFSVVPDGKHKTSVEVAIVAGWLGFATWLVVRRLAYGEWRNPRAKAGVSSITEEHADGFVSNADPDKPLPSLDELQQRKWDIDLKRVNQIDDPRSRVRKHRAADPIVIEKYSDNTILDELDDLPVIVSDHVRFSYRDRDGRTSQREVNVQKATPEYFEGFCHLRRAVRTFRYDGIRGKVLRMDTGELLTSRQWRDELL